MIRYLHIVRCRRARERIHVNVTGMAVLLVFWGMLALTACVTCPAGTPGCPQIPFSLEPRP